MKKVINYSRNDMVSKILLMQQFIMMSKPLTCIWGLCLCVMENCKGKTCLIVKNCYGYKINSPSIWKNKALSWNVERKDISVNVYKQLRLKKKRKTSINVKNIKNHNKNYQKQSKNNALRQNVKKKSLNVNISKQPNLKNRLWKKRLLF